MDKIYVSPKGNDLFDGSENRPFLTPEKAQEKARKSKGGAVVYLRGGIYCLKNPLCFDERDSGTSYMAYKDEVPVISGGKRVENWEHVSEKVWRARLSEPCTVRELYVNGKRANRAAGKKRITPCGWYNDFSNLKTEVDGILVDSSEVGLWENADEIQLHYCRGWKSMTVNVDKIIPYDDKRNIILSSHPSFAAARGGHHRIAQYTPFIIENAFEVMDTENDFYYNSKEKYLYYYTAQDMAEAEVYVPVLEELLHIYGSNLKNKVKNLTFSGITFTHAAWYRPAKYGLVTGQAHSINVTDNKSNRIFDNKFIPANIRVSAAERICFKNNVFTGLAAAAIGFYEGVNKSCIDGNVFYDICDSALTVGLLHHNYEEQPLCGYDHARNKRSYASEEYNTDEARLANSGDLTVGWFTDMPDQWWEVDLGRDTDFDRIELVSRLDMDQWDSRRSFSIAASTEDEPDNYDILFSAGDKEAYDYRSVLVVQFESHKKYRYIRVKRDIQHYFFINEVRVIDTDMEYIPFKEVCRDNTVSNNAITRTGLYHWGAPAISGYYTEGLNITHNTIWDVPYSGISLGWGWSMYTDSVTCRRNSVTYNEVYDHLNVCFDGGAVYTLGNQPGSVIKGNYFHDQPNYPGTIYMDEGTEGYTITENVVENTDVTFFIHLPTSKYIKAYDNYTTAPSYSNQGEKSDIWNTGFFIPGHYPPEAARIIENAGCDKALLEKIPAADKVRPQIDKYYNMIHETTNVPEPVFITQYYKKSIFTLENIISIARRGEMEAEKISALEKVLEEMYEFLKKPYSSRQEVIEYRLKAEERIKKLIS
ncbi:MAG: discoidin domain-containing protein [Clostridia bacterium]|nr:discoidin domain-containing protein [Clostridia bacterium]